MKHAYIVNLDGDVVFSDLKEAFAYIEEKLTTGKMCFIEKATHCTETTEKAE